MGIIKTYPKSDTTVLGYGTANDWEVHQDEALYLIANEMLNQGWDDVQYRYSFAKVRTTHDISGFSGTGDEPFFGVHTGKSGSLVNVKLVIDHIPSGYVPSLGYEIFAVTGTTNARIVHEAVVACILSMSEVGDFEVLGTVGYGDPLDSDPNTYIMWREYRGNKFKDTRLKLHRFFVDDAAPYTYQLPQPAVGLNTSAPALTGGGYACKCKYNGALQNYISVFMHRNGVGGIQPYQPAFYFMKDIPDQPFLLDAVAGVDRSFETTIDFTRANFTVALGNSYFHGSQSSNGMNGHIEVAALDLLPSASSDEAPVVTEACFGVANANQTSGVRSFRTGADLSGSIFAGFRNNARYFKNDAVLPRLTTPWGYAAAHPWTGGLAQIVETWVSFTAEAGTSAAAPVLGKLPEAITIWGSFPATSQPFTWDGKKYSIFSNSPTLVNGNLGTMAFVNLDPDAGEPAPLDCVP